jgi:hypothetical protein
MYKILKRKGAIRISKTSNNRSHQPTSILKVIKLYTFFFCEYKTPKFREKARQVPFLISYGV